MNEITVKDIKKALVCCSSDIKKSSCKKCPYNTVKGFCYNKLEKDCITLINQQQTEYEELENKYKKTLTEKIELCDVIEKQQADIEELKGFVTPTVKLINEYDISVAKIEAIKEFMERFKSEHSNLTLNDEISVDMLLCDFNRFIKEMEGDDK